MSGSEVTEFLLLLFFVLYFNASEKSGLLDYYLRVYITNVTYWKKNENKSIL